MKLVYTCEAIPNEITKSVFLAGPSLRPEQSHMISWRLKAIKILEQLNYDGVVFIPEARGGNHLDLEFSKVNEWEHKCMNIADNILFYINRNIEEGLLGLTTNTEVGIWFSSGKSVLCTEPNSDNIRYQEALAKSNNVPLYHELYNSFLDIIKKQGDGANRKGGERYIPLMIWNHPGFKSWYSNLKTAGNTLTEAKILDVSILPNGFLFSFKLWANVWIESEKRYKNNEFLITRTDISTCVMYYPCPDPLETDIIIIKEFRTPVNNQFGFVYEVPGGSTFKPNVDMKQVIIDEISEEVGFKADISKLNVLMSRQLAATMLTHQAHVYTYELDAYELQEIKRLCGTTHGNIEDTELTYVEIYKLKDLLTNDKLDWSNLGMICSVLIK